MLASLNVANREIGAKIPISIPTANALEAMMEVGKDWGEELWINLRTLHRNLMGSIESDLRGSIKAEDVIPVLQSEMDMIRGCIGEISQGKSKVVFYCCNYNNIELVLPNAIMRSPKTELQIKAVKLETEVVKTMVKQKESLGVLEFRTEIDGNNADALIITHHAVDLLSASKFRRLRLLESHTGNIKSKSEWYTKLTNGKELVNIPFNKFSLQIFGDDNTILTQMDRTTRAVVLGLAEKDRWSPVTTLEKIRYSINGLRDHFSKTILLKFARS